MVLQVDVLTSEIESGNDLLEHNVQEAEKQLYEVLHKDMLGNEGSMAGKLLDQQGAILSAISSVTYSSVKIRPDVLVGLQGNFDHLRASMANQGTDNRDSVTQREDVAAILESLEQLSEQLRKIEVTTERLEKLAVAQVRRRRVVFLIIIVTIIE
jgi:hypothetical protein